MKDCSSFADYNTRIVTWRHPSPILLTYAQTTCSKFSAVLL